RHGGELLLLPAERGRQRDRPMVVRPREPHRRDRPRVHRPLAARWLSAAHFERALRFEARANASRNPCVKSLAVTMPSTFSRRVTTIQRVFFSSITRAAARNVVSGLTVATGDVMRSRTSTFDGFLPFAVTS